MLLFKKYRDGDVRIGRINWHLDHERYSVIILGSQKSVIAYSVDATKERIPRGTAITIIYQNDTWYFHK